MSTKSERLVARADALRQLHDMTDERDSALVAAAKADPDNRPMSEEEFARAKLRKRRGRPPLARPKQRVDLRLDPDVVEHLKAGGAGWQTRLNALLREVLRLDA